MEESTKDALVKSVGLQRTKPAEETPEERAARWGRSWRVRFADLGIPLALSDGMLEATLATRSAKAASASRSIAAHFSSAYESGARPNLPNEDTPMRGMMLTTADLALGEEIAAEILRTAVRRGYDGCWLSYTELVSVFGSYSREAQQDAIVARVAAGTDEVIVVSGVRALATPPAFAVGWDRLWEHLSRSAALVIAVASADEAVGGHYYEQWRAHPQVKTVRHGATRPASPPPVESSSLPPPAPRSPVSLREEILAALAERGGELGYGWFLKVFGPRFDQKAIGSELERMKEEGVVRYENSRYFLAQDEPVVPKLKEPKGLVYGEKSRSLRAWADELGIPRSTLSTKLKTHSLADLIEGRAP